MKRKTPTIKEVTLQPEQILVPGEYHLGSESILQIYFRIFDRGHGDDLPPTIVVRGDSYPINRILEEQLEADLEKARKFSHPYREKKYGKSQIEKDRDKLARRAKEKYEGNVRRYAGLNQHLERVASQGASYLLIDGNHKSAAATLTHNPIHALELQTDNDIEEVRKTVERGELFDFKFSQNSLKGLVISYYDFCSEHLDETNTVRKRIDELVSEGDLPQYMIDRYLRK